MSNVSEKEYVNDVYDSIAEDFSRTRTRVWERVKIFIDSIKENSNSFRLKMPKRKQQLDNWYVRHHFNLFLDQTTSFL